MRGLGPLSEVRTDRPSPARIYDYWLGGSSHYPVDREVAGTLLPRFPTVRDSIGENRAFLRRAVEYVARQGVEQFLDIGCGLPFSPNVHEVAQAVVPGARVVYVDSDPIVRAQAQALIDAFPAGSYLVISHGTPDFNPAGVQNVIDTYDATSSYAPRTGPAIERLFNGLPLVAPGLVPIAQWPDTAVPSRAEQLGMYAGIARKPAE